MNNESTEVDSFPLLDTNIIPSSHWSIVFIIYREQWISGAL